MIRRIVSLCSAFILMCSAFAHADLLSDRISAKSLSLSENQAVKLASVYMIGSEHKVGFVSFNQEVTADPEEDTGCQFTNLSLPTNCAEPQNSCTKNNVTYYSSSCKTCSPGYEVENGICKVNPCTGYREEQDVAGCNHYDTCQRGLQTVYKCDSCRQGYELTEDGICNTITCDENEFPYRSAAPNQRPTICKTVSDPCYSGDDVYYGCTECNPGYIHSGGLCAETVCGTGFEDSCPAHGTCDTCQSGETTKYKLTGCETGYTINNEGNACVAEIPDHAVAFTVTTTAASQGITISTTGAASINWGDGYTEDVTGDATTTVHSYTNSGSYNVYVTGTPTIFAIINGQTYVTELLDISLPSITSYENAFKSCENMTGDLTNMTFPSGLTDGSSMFFNCSSLTGSIPTLPSGLTDGGSMFSGCSGLNGTITENNPTLPSGLTNGMSMFSDCTGLTGSIPALPDSLTNGSYMFSVCTGLTGSIPALPDSLTNGDGMFNGCSSLSGTITDNNPTLPSGLNTAQAMFSGISGLTGQCPNKPDSLTTYTNMYASTGVCCDYGDAPSQCVPPCTYVNANPLANCAEEDSCVIDDTTYYSGTCTSCAKRTVLYEGKCVPTCKGELSSDENGIKCCVTLNSQTTCLYVWCENGTDPTTPANLGTCGETTCPTGYTALETMCCKTVSNEKGTARCCGSSINATLNSRLRCTYTSCNDGYTLSNLVWVQEDGNDWTNACLGGSTPTPGGNLGPINNTCESSGYSITEPIEHCASQSTCTFLTTTYYKCSACSGIYELHNGICDYDQSTCTDPDTHDASGPGCGYCSIRKYTSHDKCSKYAVCHEKWQEGYNYYCTACDSGYNLVDGQCVKYTGNTECLNKKYTSLSTIHCTAGNGSTHETCYEMTGDGSGSWAIKKTWYYCTYCNSYIDQNWYTVLRDGQCYIENGGL